MAPKIHLNIFDTFDCYNLEGEKARDAAEYLRIHRTSPLPEKNCSASNVSSVKLRSIALDSRRRGKCQCTGKSLEMIKKEPDFNSANIIKYLLCTMY